MKLTLFVQIALATGLFGLSNAACCHKGECTKWIKSGLKRACVEYPCADGTKVNEFQCCGYRRCNIFCCNCDKTVDGKICRQASSRVRSILEGLEPRNAMDDSTMFADANTGGDGKMTFVEFTEYLDVVEEQRHAAQAQFDKFDQNGDGILTIDEMRLPAEGEVQG